jgi:Pentapeptide repeats (8 copies)
MDTDQLLKRYAAGQRDFRGVVLCNVDLHQICLSQADFRDSDLRGTNLHGTDLHETNLFRANLFQMSPGMAGLASGAIKPRTSVARTRTRALGALSRFSK